MEDIDSPAQLTDFFVLLDSLGTFIFGDGLPFLAGGVLVPPLELVDTRVRSLGEEPFRPPSAETAPAFEIGGGAQPFIPVLLLVDEVLPGRVLLHFLQINIRGFGFSVIVELHVFEAVRLRVLFAGVVLHVISLVGLLADVLVLDLAHVAEGLTGITAFLQMEDSLALGDGVAAAPHVNRLAGSRLDVGLRVDVSFQHISVWTRHQGNVRIRGVRGQGVLPETVARILDLLVERHRRVVQIDAQSVVQIVQTFVIHYIFFDPG